MRLQSEEFEHKGDLIYERGTYTLQLLDKDTGAVADEAHNHHVHIFRQQENGAWKTWRMMTTPVFQGGP